MQTVCVGPQRRGPATSRAAKPQRTRTARGGVVSWQRACVDAPTLQIARGTGAVKIRQSNRGLREQWVSQRTADKRRRRLGCRAGALAEDDRARKRANEREEPCGLNRYAAENTENNALICLNVLTDRLHACVVYAKEEQGEYRW